MTTMTTSSSTMVKPRFFICFNYLTPRYSTSVKTLRMLITRQHYIQSLNSLELWIGLYFQFTTIEFGCKLWCNRINYYARP